MIRHRWKDNKCIHCGIERKRKTQSRLMAIVNHPPWEAWNHETKMFYSEDNFETGTFVRPECITRKQ